MYLGCYCNKQQIVCNTIENFKDTLITPDACQQISILTIIQQSDIIIYIKHTFSIESICPRIRGFVVICRIGGRFVDLSIEFVEEFIHIHKKKQKLFVYYQVPLL